MTENTGLVKPAKPKMTLKDRFKKMVRNPAVLGAVAVLASYAAGFKHGQNSSPNPFEQLEEHIGRVETVDITAKNGKMKCYVGEEVSNAILKDKNGVTTMMAWDNTGKAVFQNSEGVKMVTNASGEWEAVDALSAEEQALVGIMPAPSPIAVKHSGMEM